MPPPLVLLLPQPDLYLLMVSLYHRPPLALAQLLLRQTLLQPRPHLQAHPQSTVETTTFKTVPGDGAEATLK